jgi:hypothetical protein
MLYNTALQFVQFPAESSIFIAELCHLTRAQFAIRRVASNGRQNIGRSMTFLVENILTAKAT